MAKVVVCGAMGRMGRAILSALGGNTYGLVLSGAVEAPDHALVGRDASEAVGAARTGVPVTSDFGKALGGADVAIDFTAAASSVDHARKAARAGKAIVIGSTGFSGGQLDEIRTLSKDIPCVVSPNMSVGVNLMFKVAADVARTLGEDYDVEIVEVHHRFKKDAPSGTAVRLADVVAGALGRTMEDVGVYGRRGVPGERTRKEIGVHAVRAGDVIGEHTLVFGALGERFEITHRAHSRDTFARGAVRAAGWLVGKPPGLYDMGHVLGLSR